MILGRHCKLRVWSHLCSDFLLRVGFDSASVNCFLQLIDYPFDNDNLLFVVAKDPARVLETSVVALSILCCWVVKLKEKAYQLFKMFFWFIEFDMGDFDMAADSGADLLIRRVLESWINRLGRHKAYRDTLDRSRESLLKVFLNVLLSPPVASSAKSESRRQFAILCRWCWPSVLKRFSLSHEYQVVWRDCCRSLGFVCEFVTPSTQFWVHFEEQKREPRHAKMLGLLSRKHL